MIQRDLQLFRYVFHHQQQMSLKNETKFFFVIDKVRSQTNEYIILHTLFSPKHGIYRI